MDRRLRRIIVAVAVLSLVFLCGCRGGNKNETTEPMDNSVTEDSTESETVIEGETGDADDNTTAPVNNGEIPSEGNSENAGSNNGGSTGNGGNNGGSTGNGGNNGGSGENTKPTEGNTPTKPSSGNSNTNPTEAPTVDDSFFEGPIDVVDPEDIVEVPTSPAEKPTVGNKPTEPEATTGKTPTEGPSKDDPTEAPTQKPTDNVPTTEGNSSATEPPATEPEIKPTETVKPEPTTKPGNGAIQLPMIPG